MAARSLVDFFWPVQLKINCSQHLDPGVTLLRQRVERSSANPTAVCDVF
jgi:hypothetical protein